MSVKGQPISFKSRSKGAVDITIRNPQEFTRFLISGKFQRTHMSSLLSQVFYPAFIFNAIYHNIAKLINRRILTTPLTNMKNYIIGFADGSLNFSTSCIYLV